MKRIITSALAVLMLASAATSAGAANEIVVNVRVEGAEKNLHYGAVRVKTTDGSDTTATAAEILQALNEYTDLGIKGVDTGYVSEIKGEAAGKFGGWDGWYYAVDGKAAAVGINDCDISEDSNLVLYYGGFPCQYPVPDYSKAAEGEISFKSYDGEYAADGTATYSWVPVTEANVTLNGDKYTTDASGKITFDSKKYSGFVNVQISKNDSSGAPSVCRLAPDEGFEIPGKKAQNMIVTSFKSAKASYKTLKKKDVTLKSSLRVNGKGKITFKITNISSVQKVKSTGKVTVKTKNITKKTKKIKVTKKGKFVLKKGLNKGTYKVTVRVKAAGTEKYKKTSEDVTVKIVVK